MSTSWVPTVRSSRANINSCPPAGHSSTIGCPPSTVTAHISVARLDRTASRAGSPASHSTAPSPSQEPGTSPTGRIDTSVTTDNSAAASLAISASWITSGIANSKACIPLASAVASLMYGTAGGLLSSWPTKKYSWPGRTNFPLTSIASPPRSFRKTHHGPCVMEQFSAIRLFTTDEPRSSWMIGFSGRGHADKATSPGYSIFPLGSGFRRPSIFGRRVRSSWLTWFCRPCSGVRSGRSK